MAYDFSLASPAIKSWFDKNSDASPIREFMYLHEHPLIRPNFVSDIEVLIYDTGQHMLRKNVSGAPANKLVSLAEAFAAQLNVFVEDRTEESAGDVLERLRDLYQICIRIKAL